MTVVAILFLDTVPMVITDSLISAPVLDAPDVVTPLVETENRQGIGTNMPIGMARKIWNIMDGLHFLYSGSVADATTVVGLILAKVTYDPPYTTIIHEDVVSQAQAKGLKVSFIVLQELNHEIEHFYHGDVAIGDLPGYGKVLAIGSGAIPLIQILKSHVAAPTPSLHSDAREHVKSALINGLNAAALLSIDFKSGQSLMANASSGGFFELICPTSLFAQPLRDRLEKIIGTTCAHIFCTLTDKTIILTKLVVSNVKDEMNEVIMTRDGIQLSVNDDLQVDAGDLLCARIGSRHHEFELDTYKGCDGAIEVAHAIFYGDIAFQACAHGAMKHVVRSAFNGAAVMIECSEQGMTIRKFVSSYFKSIATQLRLATCERCAKSKPEEIL